MSFHVKPYKFPIFNYGMATKGALQFPQNPTLTGAAENWEADIYVESANDILAVSVGGNTNFDGDIDIGNPLGTVELRRRCPDRRRNRAAGHRQSRHHRGRPGRIPGPD